MKDKFKVLMVLAVIAFGMVIAGCDTDRTDRMDARRFVPTGSYKFEDSSGSRVEIDTVKDSKSGRDYMWIHDPHSGSGYMMEFEDVDNSEAAKKARADAKAKEDAATAKAKEDVKKNVQQQNTDK